MTQFKVNQIFKITNLGSVVSGDIVEGEIGSGDTIRLETDGQITELKIKSVEFLDYGGGYAEVALMVGMIDNDAISILEKMSGEVVSITPK